MPAFAFAFALRLARTYTFVCCLHAEAHTLHYMLKPPRLWPRLQGGGICKDGTSLNRVHLPRGTFRGIATRTSLRALIIDLFLVFLGVDKTPRPASVITLLAQHKGLLPCSLFIR